jgi:hypothetical protein
MFLKLLIFLGGEFCTHLLSGFVNEDKRPPLIDSVPALGTSQAYKSYEELPDSVEVLNKILEIQDSQWRFLNLGYHESSTKSGNLHITAHPNKS